MGGRFELYQALARAKADGNPETARKYATRTTAPTWGARKAWAAGANRPERPGCCVNHAGTRKQLAEAAHPPRRGGQDLRFDLETKRQEYSVAQPQYCSADLPD